jgi:hypothetical protein
MPKPPPKPVISLRIRVSPVLYARINEFRFSAKCDTRQQAVRTLIAAGLAALAKPPAIPSAGTGPPSRSKLVAYAGKEPDGRAMRCEGP